MCESAERPFGKMDWQAEIASMFGLQSTLRSRRYATKGNKKACSIFRASCRNNGSGFCFPADSKLVQCILRKAEPIGRYNEFLKIFSAIFKLERKPKTHLEIR